MARTSSRVRLWQPESVEENLALTLWIDTNMVTPRSNIDNFKYSVVSFVA